MSSRLPPSPDDAFTASIVGMEVASEVSAGVRYRLVAPIGGGAMSLVYYALRCAPEGEAPVVLKLMRPWFVSQWGPTALLVVQKEAVALGRLNERVPPTPFVVRLIDTGVLRGLGTLDLPWVVVEYVHGGAEGTTLTERVERSIADTEAAFDPGRAAHFVECLSAGLQAVHEMGIIHRDVKPDNVLCCGFGDSEIFKLADFGVARPVGVVGTFGGMVVGTLGYAAPELTTQDQRAIGPWSDVFALGATIYYALTGEDYFDVRTPAEALVASLRSERRSVRDGRHVSSWLRANEQACRAIDLALLWATTGKTEQRPPRADALSSMLLPWLHLAEPPRRVHALVERAPGPPEGHAAPTDWSWTLNRMPPPPRPPAPEPPLAAEAQSAGPSKPPRVVRSVSWDGDGCCMAATSQGLVFYDGSSFKEVDLTNLPNRTGIRFVKRIAPGSWLVGGDDATFATYSTEGVRDVQQLPGVALRIEDVSGELDDLAVVVGTLPGAPPMLCAVSGRRWLKPLAVPGIAAIRGIERVDDARWLVVGDGTDGWAYAAVYAPLNFECEQMRTHATATYLACAAQWERGRALAVGAGGAVIVGAPGGLSYEHVPGSPDLYAAAIDPAGRCWAAGLGSIYARVAEGPRDPAARWEVLFHDPSMRVPISSLHADMGNITAMTLDGVVIEGRLLPPARAPA